MPLRRASDHLAGGVDFKAAKVTRFPKPVDERQLFALAGILP